MDKVHKEEADKNEAAGDAPEAAKPQEEEKEAEKRTAEEPKEVNTCYNYIKGFTNFYL